MKLDSPIYSLFYLILGILFVYISFNKKKYIVSIKFSSVNVFRKLKKPLRLKFLFLPVFLKYLGLILIIFALMRPIEFNSKVKQSVEGIDIILTLDISDSMLIEDMKPTNRLESAKNTIRDFITTRVSDRIGLIVFSGESFTLVPLTLDYEMLTKSLEKVETAHGIKMGTAIGVALANATARLEESTTKTRVIVLLTDGENNSGTIAPETSLEIAKGYGIRVYTIGIGVDGQAQLPIMTKDIFGQTRKTYQPIHSTVNDDLLGRIAQETGGKYFRSSNTPDLHKAFDEINSLEKTKYDINKYTKKIELYWKWLLIGIIFYWLSYLLEKTVFRRGV